MTGSSTARKIRWVDGKEKGAGNDFLLQSYSKFTIRIRQTLFWVVGKMMGIYNNLNSTNSRRILHVS